MRGCVTAGLLVVLCLTWPAFGQRPGAEAYEVGGPLAGVKLPLMKTQHGEPPGYPGAIPGKYGKEGLAPERELYPGSVEHYRTYYDKYLPVRSFFDRQSLLENWPAPRIEGVSRTQVETYAEPVYHVARHGGGGTVHTGLFNRPVPVVRCRVKAPVFRLDLGEQDVGLYAVRVIAAVETKNMRPFRLPLFITLRVNDGLKGEVSTYRVRCGYVDEFYSIAEIYFHAIEKRRFRAELFVDEGSQVDLLVHNVTLDDVLAGAVRQPIKSRITFHSPEALGAMKANTDERQRRAYRSMQFPPAERLRRDEAIWKAFPPLNAQGRRGMPRGAALGVPGRTAAEIEAEFGRWEPGFRGITGPVSGARFPTDPKVYDLFLVNRKLGLTYTVDDLYARRPLPDPYPYKDEGAGLYFPDGTAQGRGDLWAPVAAEVGRRYNAYRYLAGHGAQIWQRAGAEHWARDGAVALIRYAYQFPALDTANMIEWVVAEFGPHYAGDPRCRKRQARIHWHNYSDYAAAVIWYDLLFDYIQDNEELARSISRFVPWVKTADDLIELLDVYLVQMEARRILRYHDLGVTGVLDVATVMGEPKTVTPWLEWLFARTHMYPNKPAGLPDIMISNNDRNGAMYIGSTSYAYQGAADSARDMERFLAAMGYDPRFDLKTYSRKPLDHTWWSLNTVVAGHDFLRIGDVCGPDKAPGKTMHTFHRTARDGWRWSRAPEFAWMLKNVYGRTNESDEDWAAIERAAAQVTRAPWLDLRSRVVPNWAAVLETGHPHDDPRFRRAAYVRSGMGFGHNHYDQLDLQIVAHGLPMTVDGGQRSGYSKPNDRFTRIHNLVEVCEGPYSGYGHPNLHSWTQALSDAPGARYARVNAIPPPKARLYRRQVALIDVDEGEGSRPLPAANQRPNAELPKGVRTADSYVFDVFRAAGGALHSYNFHGPIDDEFQMNARDVKPVEHVTRTTDTGTEAAYLAPFSMSDKAKWAGDAPETLVATWRYSRSPGEKGRGRGTEQRMLGRNFDPQSNRKYTRLHLLGAGGMRALRADVVCYKTPIEYRITQLMAQRRGKNLESAFTAIIEPYVGEPIIESVRLLDVANNDDDALRAAAVEVKTRNGHTDLCFADGRPERTRTVGACRFAGEFAYYSTDADGLRQAALTGGTLLEGPDLRLQPIAAEYVARVAEADYDQGRIRLDAAWPATDQPCVIEIGTPEKVTTFTVVKTVRDAAGTLLALKGAPDYYRSRITELDPKTGRVECNLNFYMGVVRGLTKNWVASNEARTRFWRAEQVADNAFVLRGAPATMASFGPDGILRLWEYGVGDTVRRSTWSSVRRVAAGVFELRADVDVAVSLMGAGVERSSDRKAWTALAGARNGRWIRVTIPAAQTAAGPVFLRVR